jgi:hypothetical protein
VEVMDEGPERIRKPERVSKKLTFNRPFLTYERETIATDSVRRVESFALAAEEDTSDPEEEVAYFLF